MEAGWKEKDGKDGRKRWVEGGKGGRKVDCSHPSLPVFISNFEGDPPHLQNIKREQVRAGSESQVILLSPRYIILLPFWHHLEWIFSSYKPSSPCFLPPQEQAWPLFRESLGCLREDLSLNNTDTRFRFRECNFMSTRTVKLFYLYDGDSTTRGDAQSPFRSQIQKKYLWQCYFL